MDNAQDSPSQGHGDLRGTFIIVLLIGVIIAAVWISVYVLFLSRF